MRGTGRFCDCDWQALQCEETIHNKKGYRKDIKFVIFSLFLIVKFNSAFDSFILKIIKSLLIIIRGNKVRRDV